MKKIQKKWNKESKQIILHKVRCAQGPVACIKQDTFALHRLQFTVNATLSPTVTQSDKHMSLLCTQL